MEEGCGVCCGNTKGPKVLAGQMGKGMQVGEYFFCRQVSCEWALCLLNRDIHGVFRWGAMTARISERGGLVSLDRKAGDARGTGL